MAIISSIITMHKIEKNAVRMNLSETKLIQNAMKTLRYRNVVLLNNKLYNIYFFSYLSNINTHCRHCVLVYIFESGQYCYGNQNHYKLPKLTQQTRP